ncbi:MAG: ABC transporter permease [Fibrobacter sp.]|uniref:ABC transporter permease n=1 Tax=Fibrobacter sp. TaxID=35828 RepID=UPI001B194B5F|nr:ABC transporter permease [Fibrobacter sp.]MBO7061043.1 ABC transporter permease [Fibrobacter sp.]
MLKQYPMLRYVLQKAFWYLLTFVVAVAINFTLPRMGENNPVDIIMGKAAQGLSPEEAKLKKEGLLKAFGMAELDDQGNVVYEPEVDEKGQMKTVKVPKLDENGAPVLKTVKVTDADGNPVMEERQAVDAEGNPVFEEKPVLDKKGNPVMVKDPKTKKKVEKIEKIAVMEQVQVERQDTVMIDQVVVKDDPKLASGISQFFVYIGNVFKGDLGLSYSQYPKPVADIIKESVPWTLAIQAPTILLGWIIGNLLGAFAAYKRGIFDKVFFPLAMFLNGIPFFVFGMLLVALFSITLGWFPAMGAYSPDIPELSFNWNCIKSVGFYYVLPFFSVFPILLSGQATGMRSMSIYELGTDYMKYAKWLGLREGKIISYVFRNAMLPQLTGLAQSLGTMVGGALITEMIFSYPGLGMAMLTAIQQNDYATIQGCTLMISTCVLVANFAVDVLIAVFDPRVKAGLQMGGK